MEDDGANRARYFLVIKDLAKISTCKMVEKNSKETGMQLIITGLLEKRNKKEM